MALDITQAYRNLRTRVMFFGLEAEDLFAILALAVVANILTDRAHIIETGTESYRFRRTVEGRQKKKAS